MKSRNFWQNRARRACHEEVEVFRKPDCEFPEGSGSGCVGRGVEPSARVQQSLLLQVEKQIQRDVGERVEAIEGTGGRKSAAKTDVRQLESGLSGTQGHCRKKVIEPEQRRELAQQAMLEQGVSERRSCRLLDLSRSAYRYQAKKTEDLEIVRQLRQLAEHQPRWGYGKMIDYLRHQGY